MMFQVGQNTKWGLSFIPSLVLSPGPSPASHLSSSCLHQLILCTDQDDPLVIPPSIRTRSSRVAALLLFQPLKACPLCVRFDQKLFAAVLQHVRVLFVLLSSVLVRSPLELPLVLDFEALLRLIHYFHLHHLLLGVALFPHFFLLFSCSGERASWAARIFKLRAAS
ncbi:hypothetical protein BLNAU_8582 [Blattamonas nauphoetae]|uniref:Uncharacterized protein n=1 Tax=Blattamonas nauphoetae TaxID=2049346 RepID=A0ABQ9XYH3_9EUKA|nr:hypothetical protein BLNAU_8582 [Blattamonas nauphoetae]